MVAAVTMNSDKHNEHKCSGSWCGRIVDGSRAP
jgi:hypothetical protein